MRTRIVVLGVIAVCLFGTSSLRAQRPTLWGALEPGRWRVGFSHVDITVGAHAPFSAGVWYPAARPSEPEMRYRDYVVSAPYGLASADERLRDFQARLRTWSGWTPAGVAPLFPDGVTGVRWNAMMDMPVAATIGAPAAPGQFPAIVIATDAVMWNPIIGEYLASHGFLVMTYPDVRGRERVAAAAALERRRADLLAAIAAIKRQPSASGGVAVYGSGSGTEVSLDIVARGTPLDALILQGGTPPTLTTEQAASVTVPLLQIDYGDAPADRRAAWDVLWRTLSRAPRTILKVGGSHAEFIAASRLAYPEHTSEQHVMDALLRALVSFASAPTGEGLRAAVGKSGLASDRFSIDVTR